MMTAHIGSDYNGGFRVDIWDGERWDHKRYFAFEWEARAYAEAIGFEITGETK